MKKFEALYKIAAKRKGGEAALEKLLPKPKSKAALVKVGDDRYLAQMTKQIFQAGFVWRVIEAKWPGFEEAFFQFNIEKNAFLSPAQIDDLANDERIVRNRVKIETVPHNAQMIFELNKKYKSFASFIAAWPPSDQIGLMSFLKKKGARLGGLSAQYFLRFMGKDTFILSNDVVQCLIGQKVVEKTPTSQSDLKKVQEAFNVWHGQSGRSYSAISKTLACTIDS